MDALIRGNTDIALIQAAEHRVRLNAEMLEKSQTVENYKKIEEAAKEFEAVFLSEMLKPMFAEINKPDPLFGGGHGEEVFNGFLVQEYGKIMAERGGIGLAAQVKAELIKIQEMQNGNR